MSTFPCQTSTTSAWCRSQRTWMARSSPQVGAIFARSRLAASVAFMPTYEPRSVTKPGELVWKSESFPVDELKEYAVLQPRPQR